MSENKKAPQWWAESDDEWNRLHHPSKLHAITKKEERALIGAVVEGSEYTYFDLRSKRNIVGIHLYLRTPKGKKIEIDIEGPDGISMEEGENPYISVHLIDWD